jgi:hypothetical protein
MDKRTVDRLIEVLGALAARTQECQIKLSAIEKAMVDKSPEAKIHYQRLIQSLKSDPAIRTNDESIAAALQELRTKLSQD